MQFKGNMGTGNSLQVLNEGGFFFWRTTGERAETAALKWFFCATRAGDKGLDLLLVLLPFIFSLSIHQPSTHITTITFCYLC
jgi:hypothetical protein